MSPETHALLLEADDRHGVWQPSKPNRDKAKVRKFEVEAVRDDLSQLLSVELTRDRSVQDAAFFTALQAHEVSGRLPVFEVRFSSFGRLTSALVRNDWLASRGVGLTEVAAVLRKHGFEYVDADELRTPYDGPNHKARNEERDLTWWTRYFDYFWY